MPKIHDPETDKQIHQGRREKLRDSFLKFGLVSFNETQVLEYALGLTIPRIDTNPIAHRLINTFGSLNGVIDAHPDKILEIAGIGPQSALFLSFLKQFVTYYMSAKNEKPKITNSQDAIKYLSEVMQTYSTEQFVLLCLDKKGQIILQETTSSNDLDKVDINLRQIIDIVLRVKTASVIVAHNHMDDNPTPSGADASLTRYLVNVLTPLSVSFIDHIIFCESGKHYSFLESGLLQALKVEHKSFASGKDYMDYFKN